MDIGGLKENYFSIEYKNITKKDCNKIHCHDDVEVIFVKEGDLNIVIDYKLYHLSQNDIVFVNSHISHTLLLSDDKNAEIYFVHFPPESIYLYSKDLFNITYFFWLSAEATNKFFIYNLSENQEVAENIYKIYEIYQNKTEGYEYVFLYRVIMLCVWFFEQWAIKSERKIPKFSHTNIILLKNIFEEIEKNYAFITANELSNLCNLPYNAVAKQFNDIMGMSFRHYIEKYKISKAKHILATTRKPITEIAFELGYNNSSYFSKIFCRNVGLSPSVFRKENQVNVYLNNLSLTEEVDKTVQIEEVNKDERLNDTNRLFYNSITLSAYENYEPKKSWLTNDFYEIIYADLGETHIEFETETYKLSPGEIALIFPYTRRRISSPNEGGNRILLIQFYPMIANIATKRFDFFDGLKNSYKIFNILKSNEYEVLKSLYNIFKEKYKFEPSSEMIMRANILNLISWMISQTTKKLQNDYAGNKSKKDRVVREVINYIDDHYKENLTLEELSKKFGISYGYLSKNFKKLTKCNLKRYINDIRLMHASFFLITTNYTITEIASMLGFCSRNRFAEKYFQLSGYSPTDFRKHFRNNEALYDYFKKLY